MALDKRIIENKQVRLRLLPFLALRFLLLLLLETSAASEARQGKQANAESGSKNSIKIAQMPAAAAGQRSISSSSLLARGTQLIDAGRLNEALDLFQGFCRSRPQDPRAYFWMGVCYDEMGKHAMAAQAFRDGIAKAEQQAMDSSEIRMNLGNALLKMNQVDEAIEAYKRAIEINPQYGLAELNLGRAFLQKGDYRSALAAFEKCDELHFNVRQLSYYKAKTLLGLGKKDEAAGLVRRLLQDFPEGSARAEIEAEFKSCLDKNKQK